MYQVIKQKHIIHVLDVIFSSLPFVFTVDCSTHHDYGCLLKNELEKTNCQAVSPSSEGNQAFLNPPVFFFCIILHRLERCGYVFKVPDLVMAGQLFPKSMLSDLMFSGRKEMACQHFLTMPKVLHSSSPTPKSKSSSFMPLQALKNKFWKLSCALLFNYLSVIITSLTVIIK